MVTGGLGNSIIRNITVCTPHQIFGDTIREKEIDAASTVMYVGFWEGNLTEGNRLEKREHYIQADLK